MTLQDVDDWIRPTEEIHKSKKLADWIQRRLREEHADRIASYLLDEKERFFSALVVGVYEGEPAWASLHIREGAVKTVSVTAETAIELEKSVGLLHLSGTEKLFAIDGQHRVVGIRRALERAKGAARTSLANEEVTAIFVGHANEKVDRTRRLFTTLNKKARRVGEPRLRRSSGIRVARESRVEIEVATAEEDCDAEVDEAAEAECALLDHLDG